MDSAHRFAAGVRLSSRLNEALTSGRATRSALEVERLLAVCRCCEYFRGDDCAAIGLSPLLTDGTAPNYIDLLTRTENVCCRWHAGERREASGVRSQASGLRPQARRVDTAQDALDRLHRTATTRTQAERRAARRRAG